MNAHVEHNWQGRSIDIWLFRGPGVQLRFEQGHYQQVKEGDVHPPSLSIPVELFEDLMREAEGVVPAGTGTTEALRDTRQVRDRLLALVEKLAK